MFYLKIIGVLLLVVTTTLCGFLMAEKLKLRRDYLISFIDFLYNLEVNIRFTNEDIFLLITKSAKGDMLNFNADFGDSYSEYWSTYISRIPSNYGLTDDDYTLLKDFGSNLGTSDVEGQKSHIELYKNLFSKQLANAELEYTNKSKLYKILGFFLGTVIALMII